MYPNGKRYHGIRCILALKRVSTYCVLFSLLLVLVTSCAQTTLLNVWKDQSYKGRISKVIILGVARRPSLRRVFEAEFSQQLQIRGIDAVPSFTVLPSTKMLDKESIVSLVKKEGVNGIIITRLVERKTVETYVPAQGYTVSPPGMGWHGHYMSSYSYVHTTGYTIKDEVVILETNLYDAGTEELIWSATTETIDDGPSDSTIKSFIKKIVKNMTKGGHLN